MVRMLLERSWELAEEKRLDPDDPNLSLFDIAQYQSKEIGKLLDYNQAIVLVCRQQAENWQTISQAYIRCAQMAGDIAESCAVAARISVDRTGDIISSEFDLVEIEEDEEGEEDA